VAFPAHEDHRCRRRSGQRNARERLGDAHFAGNSRGRYEASF
jgi:hypothetical protein